MFKNYLIVIFGNKAQHMIIALNTVASNLSHTQKHCNGSSESAKSLPVEGVTSDQRSTA